MRSCDVVVVGAGIVGLSCAWRAARRGMSVLCVDAGARPGAGASHAAAGMLAPVTEADFGEEALLRLNLEAAGAWPGFRAELEEAAGTPVGHVTSGALEVAADRDDVEEIHRRIELQRSLGLGVEWLTGRECRRREPGLSPRVSGGIEAPRDGHVDPRAVMQALAIALRVAGGTVLTGARASVTVEDDRTTGVEVEGRGHVSAEQVVAAPGADARKLSGVDPAVLPPVRPVKGQILRLRRRSGAGPLAERIIRSPRCYVLDRDDGEVVVGGTVEERGEDRAVTGGAVYELLEAARKVLPDVDELEWVEASTGLRPGTPDNAPVIGRHGPEGLLWATGHFRHGVLLAPLTAEAVAAMLAGEEPTSIAAFSPARFEMAREEGDHERAMATVRSAR